MDSALFVTDICLSKPWNLPKLSLCLREVNAKKVLDIEEIAWRETSVKDKGEGVRGGDRDGV